MGEEGEGLQLFALHRFEGTNAVDFAVGRVNFVRHGVVSPGRGHERFEGRKSQDGVAIGLGGRAVRVGVGGRCLGRREGDLEGIGRWWLDLGLRGRRLRRRRSGC